jgi:hypothetical protein
VGINQMSLFEEMPAPPAPLEPELMVELLRQSGLLGAPIMFRLGAPETVDDPRRRLARCPWCDGAVARIDLCDGLGTWTCDHGHDYLAALPYIRFEDGSQVPVPHLVVRPA